MNPKDWYKNCGDAIRKEFGRDADLFIDLLAATSPQKSIAVNWRLATRIYHIWRTKNPVLEGWKESEIFSQNLFAGTLPAHRYNIMRALKGEPLSGNKVKAFAANLKGDLDAVTIDVWMQRYYGQTGTLTTKKYNELAEIVRSHAKLNFMKPAEYQATVWHKMKKKHGKKPYSYLDMMNKDQLYFEFYLED